MEMLSAHVPIASALDSEQIWKIVTYLRSLKQAG